MTVPPPPTVPTGTVTHRYLGVSADGPDTDTAPDLIHLRAVTGTITPSTPRLVHTSGSTATTLECLPITISYDASGNLQYTDPETGETQPGPLRLPANDDSVAPTITYEVVWSIPGLGRRWSGSFALDAGDTVDLSTVGLASAVPGSSAVFVDLLRAAAELEGVVDVVSDARDEAVAAADRARDISNISVADDVVSALAQDVGTATHGAIVSAVAAWLGTGPQQIPFAGYDIPVTITRTGGAYHADIDHEAMHRRGPGVTMYVDPVNGSNSNDGLSWATAKADPGSAFFDRGDYGVAEVILRGGVYTRAQSSVGLTGRPDSIVRAEPGTRPIFTQCDTSTSWTLHAGTTHKVALSGPGMVMDRSRLDAQGLPVVLQKVPDIAAVVATPGSAYHDGTTQYVHLHDGRAPDSDVLVSRNTYHLNLTSSDPGSPYSILLDGVEFWGGLYARVKARRAGDQLIAKNCAWRYAAENGLGVQGFERVVLIDCAATHNGVDGFNYHDETTLGLSGQVLEIDCIGSDNGQQAGGSSQNGSTAHEDYKIVRVNGVYERNPGPNVADVNRVLSANYGVTARDALGYAGVADFDYTAPEGGGQLWLYHCVSTSARALRNAAAARLRMFVHAGTIEGGTPTYI